MKLKGFKFNSKNEKPMRVIEKSPFIELCFILNCQIRNKNATE